VDGTDILMEVIRWSLTLSRSNIVAESVSANCCTSLSEQDPGRTISNDERALLSIEPLVMLDCGEYVAERLGDVQGAEVLYPSLKV